MRYCDYLLRDINFEPDAIQPCCNVRALGSLPRFPFAGGSVDLSAYVAHIQRTLAALQEDGPMCRGCPEVREVNADDVQAAVQLRTVSINMHRSMCNCRCVYCGLWGKPRRCYDVLPAIRSLWSQGAFHPECVFSWGGGEPTLLKEFDAAVDWLARKRFPQYVHTNALRYSEEIGKLLGQGMMGINISLDAGTPAVYKAVKGVDGFVRATENLRRYIAAAKDRQCVAVKYIVFSGNDRMFDIDAFIALCRDMGVAHVEFSFDFREVNAGRVSDGTVRSAVRLLRGMAALGVRCIPFFVDESLKQRMLAMA